MARDGVSWVRGGLVETALAAYDLAVRRYPRHPSLPSLGSCSTWELVSVSDLRQRWGYIGKARTAIQSGLTVYYTSWWKKTERAASWRPSSVLAMSNNQHSPLFQTNPPAA
jgi:hypothetical protein